MNIGAFIEEVFDFINIVIEFTKTSCSNDNETKKCMGTSKTDQFNGEFVKQSAKIPCEILNFQFW